MGDEDLVMPAWFRFYAEVLNDPKIQILPITMKWRWVELLCLASQADGCLPSLKEVSFALRLSEAKTKTILDSLVDAGLFDRTEDCLRPHNWDGRQYFHGANSEVRSNAGTYGNHVRWHVTPQKPDPDCVYCVAESNAPATEFANRTVSQMRLANRRDSDSDSDQKQIQRSDPDPISSPTTQNRPKTPLKDHPLNFKPDEWRYFHDNYADRNPIRRFQEWVNWIEEGGGESSERWPRKNKKLVFEGFLKKQV